MYRCVVPLACKALSMCFAVCMNVSVGEPGMWESKMSARIYSTGNVYDR